MSRYFVPIAAAISAACLASPARADKLPYTNSYEIYLANPGDVELTLKTTRYATRLGVALEEIATAQYINAPLKKGQTATLPLKIAKPQTMDFELLNVPDNHKLWYPRDVQQSSASYDARSVWPKYQFDPTSYTDQSQVWDFGDGGVLTIHYKGLSPEEIAAQAAARAKAEAKAKLAAAQVAALAVGPPVIGCAPHEGPYNGDRGDFWRNMCSTAYCGNQPESWVRGGASYDRRSGQLSWDLQLETDDTWAGPKGSVHVDLVDNNGAILASADSATEEIGGKHPGNSRINDMTGYQNFPISVPATAMSVTVRAQCMGQKVAPFGIDPAVFLKAAQLIISAVAGGSGQPQNNPPPDE